MFLPQNTKKMMTTKVVTAVNRSGKQSKDEQGSALVAAVIILVILTALGVTALNVADLNINIAANDRDAKDAFFHADAGVNIGHEFLEEAIFARNSTYYGTKAFDWQDNLFNAAAVPFNASSPFYENQGNATYIGAGLLERGIIRGSSIVMAAGYRGRGYSAAHGGSYGIYLIRSHRIGVRNSQAEVDLAWRHVNN